ncbi:hypothetical protein KZI27_00095 (plasmid) [Curtobacterium sp. TC1]|uniref:hypothetical protein n=1 Tax=Curtobacterium sp. TC1 TaxID=2862880 RepID=UPI001C9A8102|nr:hypothetical protein [Curtobacterium sp. TC1]QZQ53678.1 hypothetical protein KZI27_00095 [Curtobacterium sp. TC1]
MLDKDIAIATDLERQIIEVTGVAKVYQRQVLHSAERSLATWNARGQREPHVTIFDGIVTVIIGTAEGSIARDVAHEVHAVVLGFLTARGLPLVRVDVQIATIGLSTRR